MIHIGRTLVETTHGNPGEHRVLPRGILVYLSPATNLPEDSPIKWWAGPYDSDWPKDTEEWAFGPGVGLHASDVEIIR